MKHFAKIAHPECKFNLLVADALGSSRTNSQLSITPLDIGALGDREAMQVAAQAVKAEIDLLFEHAAQLARHPGAKKNRALPISRAKPQAVPIGLSRISAVAGSCPDARTEGYK